MKKEGIIKIIGILFLIIGIAAYLNAFSHQNYDTLFWFCYICIVLIGIGFLTNNAGLIASQVNILFVPLVFWGIDFLFVLNGSNLFGMTNYFFELDLISKIISSQHLFTPPLAIFGIYLIGLKRKDFWKISFVEVSILFVLTRIFTNSMANINDVFSSSIGNNISGISYSIQWFVGVFVMIFLVNILLVKIFYKRKC